MAFKFPDPFFFKRRTCRRLLASGLLLALISSTSFAAPKESFVTASAAAPANDHCSKATKLADVTNWCSSPRQYTNEGATPSGADNPVCFPSYLTDPDNDVWFQFTAVATTVNVSVIGAIRDNPKGTLQFPQMALYRGNCGGLLVVACISDSRGYNIVETFVTGLSVGGTYYIRVDGRNGKRGSFQLCTNNFNPVPSPSSDCSSAVVLCDKSSFTVPSVLGAGNNKVEITSGTCLQEESSSAWYKWTCANSGTLSFTLRPVNPADDLDFAVFLLPNGVNDCTSKIPLRCMAAGENVEQPYAFWAKCTGSTGLRSTSSDLVEERGCDEASDNFLAPILMEAGKSYVLIVNNYHNTGNGFSIEFGGTGTFVGPKAHFTVSKLTIEKNQPLTIKNASEFSGGISGWEWNFGVGASPQTATGSGPHTVKYNSKGKKSISLSIKTGNGCKVTKVREITVVDPPPPPPPPPPVEKVPPSAKKEPEPAPEEPRAIGVDSAHSPLSEATASTEPMPPPEPPKLVEQVKTAPPKSDTVRTLVEYTMKYIATIYFKADSSSLNSKDIETLDKVLKLMQDYPAYLVVVEGHTNNIPDDIYCEKLGGRRADVVIDWLRGKGIGEERISRKVLGKKRVVTPEIEHNKRRINQRVEIKLLLRD